MKILPFITCVLFLVQGIGQIPPKDDFMKAYYEGHKIFEAVLQGKSNLIKEYYTNTKNLQFLVKELNNNKYKSDSIRIYKDVMFNQETGLFDFFVFYGDHISADDSWGLMDYKFVVTMKINLSKELRKDKLTNIQIINKNEFEKLKNWWQNYMDSYKQNKYARYEISEKYDLVPPPPPPPGSTSWFSKD